MSIKIAQEIKQLESRLAKLKQEKTAIDAEYAEICGKQSRVSMQIQSVKSAIDDLKKGSPEIIVTEHAIIRFMERAMGLDLGQVKRQILATSVAPANGKYPIGNGLKAVVRDGSVVTVE